MEQEFSSEKLNDFLEQSRAKTLTFLSQRFTALSDADLEDVYQEASVALYTNIIDGKLKTLTSSLYTYFLSIAINQALTMTNKKTKIVSLDALTHLNITEGDDFQDEKIDELLGICDESNDAKHGEYTDNLVRGIVDALSGKCRDLLWGHYGDNLSWAVLADMYMLSNADTAKSTANRCRNKFRDKYNELIAKH